jgi:hypothetical protein
MTVRKADQYRFVVRSKYASKLQHLGIAKALLLARVPKVAEMLLEKEDVDIGTLPVKDLKAALGPTKPPKQTTDAVSDDYREGFADGQQTTTTRGWAAGVLFLRPAQLAGPDALPLARRHYEMLRNRLGPEMQDTLDEAIQILDE